MNQVDWKDVLRIFEPFCNRLTRDLDSGMTWEIVGALGDAHEIRYSAVKDIRNAVRYLEVAQHEHPEYGYGKIVRDLLQANGTFDYEDNIDIIREYFPHFLKWKRKGQKKIYIESLAYHLATIEVSRQGSDDSIRKGQDIFGRDLSFFADRSGIHAPNPMLRDSFSISLAQQLEEALDNEDFSFERTISYILQLKEVDLRNSRIFRDFFNGHFANKTSFFEQLACFVAVALSDYNLFSLLEKKHQPGARALGAYGYHRHFSFVCHSSIPTIKDPDQYTDIPPRMTVYVASIAGTVTTLEEGARRVDQDLLRNQVVHFSSVYHENSKAPNFIMSFESGGRDQYALQRLDVHFQDGQRRVVRRPCRYKSTFRLKDVLRQMLIAFPNEWIEISLLGCQKFEQQNQNMTQTPVINEVSSMLQVPSCPEQAYISLKFTDLETAQSDETLLELLMFFSIDKASGIFRSLVGKLESLRAEVGCEIAALNQNQNNTDAMQLEDYIESMLRRNPFDTRVSSNTWNAVIEALTKKTPVRVYQQQEFCSIWNFNPAYLPLM